VVYYLLAMSEFFTVDETHFSLVNLKVNEEVKFGERFSASNGSNAQRIQPMR
jgi:hypothetical protein